MRGRNALGSIFNRIGYILCINKEWEASSIIILINDIWYVKREEIIISTINKWVIS